MGHGASIAGGYCRVLPGIIQESQCYVLWDGSLWLQDRATEWCDLVCLECGRPGATEIQCLGVGWFDSLECRDRYHDRFSMVPCIYQGARLAPRIASAA